MSHIENYMKMMDLDYMESIVSKMAESMKITLDSTPSIPINMNNLMIVVADQLKIAEVPIGEE